MHDDSMGVDAYPLAWPAEKPRTPAPVRKRGRFGVRRSASSSGYRCLQDLTVAEARDRILAELSAMTPVGHPYRVDPAHVVISSNVPTRNDGLPRSGARQPDDPGVCAYFELDGEPHALPCDRWDRVADNMAAIAAHIGALRGIERWGVGDLREAFTAWKALPDPDRIDWREVLGYQRQDQPTLVDLERRFRELASTRHPDKGGSNAEFARLGRARELARAALA